MKSNKIRILIIDNDTKALRNLEKVLKGRDFKIMNFRNFKKGQENRFTHIILTGGDHWVNLRKFSEEVKLIRNPPVPILGICYGMQLIGRSFKSTLIDLDRWIKGNKKVNLRKDKLFKNLPEKVSVFEYRGYALSKAGKDIKVIATSDEGIEAIKHKSLSVWGVQFHPEVKIEGKNYGEKIINNFLSL